MNFLEYSGSEYSPSSVEWYILGAEKIRICSTSKSDRNLSWDWRYFSAIFFSSTALVKGKGQELWSNIEKLWPAPVGWNDPAIFSEATEDQEILGNLRSFWAIIEAASTDFTLPSILVVQPHPVAVNQPLPLHLSIQSKSPWTRARQCELVWRVLTVNLLEHSWRLLTFPRRLFRCTWGFCCCSPAPSLVAAPVTPLMLLTAIINFSALWAKSPLCHKNSTTCQCTNRVHFGRFELCWLQVTC